MRLLKKQSGFTLVELMLVILVSSIVLFSTTAVAMNIVTAERASRETAKSQSDARMLTSWLQQLASDGHVTKVEFKGANATIFGESDTILAHYDAERGVITNGVVEDSTVILDNVSAFVPVVKTTGDGKTLLTVTISVVPKGRSLSSVQTYTMSSFNRVGKIISESTDAAEPVVSKISEIPDEAKLMIPNGSEQEVRKRFLSLLATQYGSDGTIQIDGLDPPIKIRYSDWYSNGTWPANTPWCACFVSWAANIAKQSGLLASEPPIFASCMQGRDLFKDNTEYAGYRWYESKGSYNPVPGDYVFFDLNHESWSAELDHVGVVLYCDSANIYTIEGNSNNQVSIRQYDIDDPDIVGYGVLDWNV